jgi:hypothetical protein
LVIDDYEDNCQVLGDFLVSALVPRLADAGFQVTMVICCRDDLVSTNSSWSQHVQKWMKEDLRLKPFDKATAVELMTAAGVPAERHEALFDATKGFPFLLTLAIEEATTVEGQSALFAKKFFERTTRWMNEDQREWFKRICYLEHVDEDTLARVVPKAQVREVQDWFENEASIRDPDTARFAVRPLIRLKTLEYLEVRSPTWHREMKEQVKNGQAVASDSSA